MTTLTDRAPAESLPDLLTLADRPPGSGIWLGVAHDGVGITDAWLAASGPLLILGSGGTGGTVLCRAIGAQEPDAVVYSEHAARFGVQHEHEQPVSGQEFIERAPHAPVAILDGLDEPSLPEDEGADLLAAALLAEVAVIRTHRLPRIGAGLERVPVVRLVKHGRGWLQSGVSTTAPAIRIRCPWVPPHVGAPGEEGVSA